MLALGLFFLLMAGKAGADGPLLQPPYLVTGIHAVLVGVQWEKEAVLAALPPEIKPVKGMTGGVSIYQAVGGYGLSYPYEAGYFWVDVEGFDSEGGTKGRWMLAGAYGPDKNIAAQISAAYGWPVRTGLSRTKETPDGKRAIATVNGNDVAIAEITLIGECAPISGRYNYPGKNHAGQIVSVLIPYTGTWCPAQPVSMDVVAPAGDPFGKFKPVKLIWAGQVNLTTSVSRPILSR